MYNLKEHISLERAHIILLYYRSNKGSKKKITEDANLRADILMLLLQVKPST
jgi:hypothetical protein